MCFDPWDSRKLFGLITCGSCSARVSATLQVFTPEWFLMAQFVDWGNLEKLKMYWVFSLCGRKVGEEEEVLMEESVWENNQEWDMKHTDDLTLFRRTKMTMQFLSQARCVCVPRLSKLYCRCVLWVGVLSWSCCSDCAACCVVVVERRVNREDHTLVVNGGDRGLQFYQTRSHAIVLHDTLPAFCIEKTVCMKTKEKLYLKVRSTPRLPRVVLKAKSHSGQQDQREQDTRSSRDQHSESKSYRETWNNAVDYRIPGMPLRLWNSRIRTAKTRSRSWLKRESYPSNLVPRLSASGFSETYLEKRVHLNLVTHNPIARQFTRSTSFLSSLSLLGNSSFSALYLVVHQPCDAETDTCLQPYNPVSLLKNRQSGGSQHSQDVRVQLPLKKVSALLTKNGTHGYFCLGYFSSRHFDLRARLAQKAWRQCVLVLCTILGFVTEPASVSLRTLAFFFQLVNNTFSSFNADSSVSIFSTAPDSILLCPASKFS